ncbi:MAG: DUF2490 domain-containing protein [Crocinitomicaceae bacterium]|nr:DUF2490 domain-containing protein [Crocinitomicaceae bacterium]
MITTAKSQALVPIQDIGFWTGAGLKYSLKKWEFGLKSQLRTNNNALSLDECMAETGVNYEISKNFSIASDFRYSYTKGGNQEFRNDLRYNLDFNYKQPFAKDFSFNLRLRYQHRFTNMFTFTPEYESDFKYRFRGRFKWNKKTHKFYSSTELFRSFTPYTKAEFDALRIVIGDKLNFNNNIIDLSLAYQRNTDNEIPFNFYFLRVIYTLNIERD